jgi:hypothetical protein
VAGRARVLATALIALAATGASAPAVHAAPIVTAMNSTSSSALLQDGRLIRDGNASSCGTMKATPMPTLVGTPLRYRVHTFASRVTNPLCIDVSLSTACTNLFSVSYLGTFDPANPSLRYAADAGSSVSPMTYSFDVPAGAFFSIVVHEADTVACAAYTITVSSRGPWTAAPPSIAGAAALGGTLSAADATWVGTPAVARSWLRCNSAGAACTAIAGATGTTYAVAAADIGRTLRFRSEATDADGTSGSDSAFAEAYIPFETHGTESLGAGDRVHQGIFVRDVTESRCSAPKTAPTILQPASTFLYDTFPVRSLLNEPVCLVTRTVPDGGCGGGVSPSLYSPAFSAPAGLAANYAGNSGNAFGSVGLASTPLPAGQARELIVSHGSSMGSCDSYSATLGADAPFATARPAIGGTAATGSVLTISNGTWSGSPAFARSWRRCDSAGNACVPIAGATGASYAPVNADIGRRLRARVTATRGRAVSSDSAASAVVLDRTGPVGRLRLGSRNLRKALKRGRIPVRVRSDEACAARIELRVSRKLAKRLKLRRRVVIAKASGRLAANRTRTFRPKLTRAARRALKGRKSLRFRIRATLTDTAGNRSRPSRAASLKPPRR